MSNPWDVEVKRTDADAGDGAPDGWAKCFRCERIVGKKLFCVCGARQLCAFRSHPFATFSNPLCGARYVPEAWICVKCGEPCADLFPSLLLLARGRKWETLSLFLGSWSVGLLVSGAFMPKISLGALAVGALTEGFFEFLNRRSVRTNMQTYLQKEHVRFQRLEDNVQDLMGLQVFADTPEGQRLQGMND